MIGPARVEPAHQQWKQAVLAGEIEFEGIDTRGHRMTEPQLVIGKAVST